MSKFVKYTEIIADNIVTPKKATQKSSKEKIPFYELPITYRYLIKDKEGKEGVVTDSFLIEGPKVSSLYGVQNKVFNNDEKDNKKDEKKRDNWSLTVSLNPSTVLGDKTFIEKIGLIHQHTCGVIGSTDMKFDVGMKEFEANRPGMSYKNPVYVPSDRGQIIEGKANLLTLKVKNPQGGYGDATLFTQPDVTKKIDIKLLQNVEMELIPIIHVSHVHIGGGKMYLQLYLKSAIVTKVKARNSESLQTDTAKALLEENRDIDDSVSADLARLAMQNQDKLLPPKDFVADPLVDSPPSKDMNVPSINKIPAEKTQEWLNMAK